MVSVGVSRMDETGVIFIEPEAKVSSSYCKRVLDEGLLPDIIAKCRQYRWTLQQDGAPPHTAKNMLGLYSNRVDIEHVTTLISSSKCEIIQTV